MKLSVREQLAQFIMEGEHTYLEWASFQKRISNLRLKTFSQGKVLIALNDNEFELPEIWLGNFQARMISQLEDGISKLRRVLPKERFEELMQTKFSAEDEELLSAQKVWDNMDEDCLRNNDFLATLKYMFNRGFGMSPAEAEILTKRFVRLRNEMRAKPKN